MRLGDSYKANNDLEASLALEATSCTLASLVCSRSRRASWSNYVDAIALCTRQRRRRSHRSSTTSTRARAHSRSSRKHRKALRARSSRIAYDWFVRSNNDLRSCDDNLIANRCLINIDATINSWSRHSSSTFERWQRSTLAHLVYLIRSLARSLTS